MSIIRRKKNNLYKQKFKKKKRFILKENLQVGSFSGQACGIF